MGGQSSQSGKTTRYYSLKAKADDTNTPAFVVSVKNSAGKWEQGDRFDTMVGMLVSGSIKEKEYEGAKMKIFVLTLEDDNETSVVEMTHNGITHSIINSLASNCNKLDIYHMQVYKKQSNGKWYGQVSIKIGEERVNWSIDPKAAPQKEKVIMADGSEFIQNGKPVYSDTKVKEFWEKMFTEKIANVLKPAAGQTASNTAQTTNSASTSTPADDDSSDLPF